MISIIGIFLTACFYAATGWSLTYMLGKQTIVERLGIAFLLGNGLTTLFWFILYRLGAPFTIPTLLFSGLIIWMVSHFLNKSLKIKYQNLTCGKVIGLNRWLAYLITTLLLVSFTIGSYNPISAWDSVALYDFRGHTIALNHSLKDLTDGSYYISYPLMISLDHAAIYMLGGTNAQGFHSLILMAFVAVVYGRMRKWSSLRLALLTVLFIILNDEIFAHSTVAYANLPYVAYIVTGFLYTVSPTRKNRELGYLFLGGLLMGLTTWIRSDAPFWLIGIILILVQGWWLQTKLLSLLTAAFVYLIRYTWLSFYYNVLRSLKLRNDRLSNPITVNALKLASSTLPNAETIKKVSGNLPEIAWYMYQHVFSPYRGLWLLSIPIAIIAVRKKDSRLILLLLAICLSAGMITLGVMIFSATYVTWEQIGGSARRMMLFIVPLSIIASVYALHLVGVNKDHDH